MISQVAGTLTSKELDRVEVATPGGVTYELTKQGRSFGDVSAAIVRWGRELCTSTPAAPRRRRA